MIPQKSNIINRAFPLLSGDRSHKMVTDNAELVELFKDITVAQIPNRVHRKEFRLIDMLTLNDHDSERYVIDPDLRHLHRYDDINLFSHSMIRPDPNKPHSSKNHINANKVVNPYDPQTSTTTKYIATQGPLQRTADHFWRMIENHKVTHILMILEKSKVPNRCWNYWTQEVAQLSEYAVRIVKVEEGPFIDHRRLELTNLATKKSFEVSHFHLHQWVDHYLIPKEHYTNYLQFLHKMTDLDRNFPGFKLVVHCSAGIGRTGTFYASLFLFYHFLECLKAQTEFTFSVMNVVRFLREQRFYAVENQDQYAFLYTMCAFYEAEKGNIK